MWKYYALLSALFAALTAILAKVGVRGVDSDLATAIRTSVILILTWGIALAGHHEVGLRSIGTGTWVALILSGIATGLSWLFYFMAIKSGNVSRVAPIDKLSVVFAVILAVVLFGEKVSLVAAAGVALITAGALMVAMG